MKLSNNFSVLPFYGSVNEQHHRKSYSYGSYYDLFVRSDRLIPFQFSTGNKDAVQSTEDFRLMRFDGHGPIFPQLNHTQYTAGSRFSSDLITVSIDSPFSITENGELYCETVGAALTIEVPHGYKLTKLVFDDLVGSFEEFSYTVYTPEEPTRVITLHTDDHFKMPYIEAYIEGPRMFSKASLISVDTNSTVTDDILPMLVYSGLCVIQGEHSNVVLYPASRSFDSFKLNTGRYYLIFEDTDENKYVSEVFTVVDSVDNCIEVEWYDYANLLSESSEVIYNADGHNIFKNCVYIQSDIGKPDYDFDEEGDERDGYFFATKQVSKKIYKFTFVAPEFLCDAMRLIRLSDNIVLRYGNDEHVCDSFLVSPDWEEQGDLAGVDIEFTTGTVIKKVAAAWPR